MSEDLRLSVSKVKTFKDCGAKYKFVYIEKLPRKDRDFHIFGKFCHKVLEEFHSAYIKGCLLPYNIVMSDAFKLAWAEYKDKMTPDMKKECWEVIDKYLRAVTNDRKNNLSANVLAVEKNFELPIAENIILNGMIDRIQIDADNVIHVCDYKTVKKSTSIKFLEKDFFQLLTYAYVMWLENPDIKKVRASYILLRHNFQYITTEFTVDQIMEVKNKYIEYANKINTEQEFKPNPTILCNYCDHLNLCPEGKAVADFNNVYGEVKW